MHLLIHLLLPPFTVQKNSAKSADYPLLTNRLTAKKLLALLLWTKNYH
mgnify:FL=1